MEGSKLLKQWPPNTVPIEVERMILGCTDEIKLNPLVCIVYIAHLVLGFDVNDASWRTAKFRFIAAFPNRTIA